MIRVNDKKECCGCNACVQSCPKKCIVMARDEEGFLYPEVDYSQCVECGLCEKACPILNAEKKQDMVLKCYVAYAKDESIRLQSSSGGVFTLLAEAILQKQGIVFGASLDENMQVKHISIDNVADLSLLRGSKYVQSDIGNTYIEVKKNLENGRQVLFSGTACQIAGLKQYLRKDFENLYTIDILCHGVPSPKVWDLYLQWQKEEMQKAEI